MRHQIRVARQIRGKSKDKGRKTVYLRIFPQWEMRGQDFVRSTRLTIDKQQWDARKGKVKGSGLDVQRINAQIQSWEGKVYDCFEEYQRTTDKPDLLGFESYLDSKLYGKTTESPKVTIYVCDIFERYIAQKKSTLSPGRQTRYRFVEKNVNEFNVLKFGTVMVDIRELNRDWFFQFKEFMLGKFQYKSSTITGILKALKATVRDLFESDLLDKYPFKNCPLSYSPGEIRYLSMDDLNKIIQFKTSDERLQSVADCFVFASQTGMAHADMRSLKYRMIKMENGTQVIRKYRVKTNVECVIPLNKMALAIIEKYRPQQAIAGSKFVLPVVHMNDYNKLLKVIALHCGIQCNLTSHMARHSFSTTVWLEKEGTTLDVLQKILGHKKRETTAIYGKITSKRVVEEANKVFNPESDVADVVAAICKDGGLYPDKLSLN